MAQGDIASLPLGASIRERYQIVSVVGQGGLGTVYQVVDTRFVKSNVYAIKELAGDSPGARRQFTQEARWLQALSHNHIPRVHEYFEWQGRLYLVMDFVDGENLDQKLRHYGGRPLPERQVISWIVPICDALQYLHTRQPPILHRDVKPSNVIVTPAGYPVLVDLGIAKAHLPGQNQTATFVRKAGTEGYAPPEQYTSSGQAGPWSDVYSLGATVYELLTGCVPATAVERVALDTRLLPVRELNPAISAHVAEAVARAIALRPMDRFPLVAEFAAALLGPADPAALKLAPVSGRLRPASGAVSLGAVPSTSGHFRAVAHAIAPSASPLPAAPSVPPSFSVSRPPQSPPVPITAPSRPSQGAAAPVTPRQPSQPPPGEHPSARLPTERATTGARDAGYPRRAPQPAPAPAEGRVRSWPRYVLLGLGVALVLAVVAAYIAVQQGLVAGLVPPDRSSPQIAVNGYFQAIQVHNPTLAWQYVTSSRSDQQDEGSFAAGLAADDQRYGAVVSWQIVSVQVDSQGQTDIVVNVRRAKATAPLTYTLVLSEYDGTTWLIASISSA